VATSSYSKRSISWTALTVLSVVAVSAVCWFLWAYREAWFGSTSNLSMFESGMMFFESILICLWIVFRSGLAPISRMLLAIIASVGGLMCGIGVIARKTEVGSGSAAYWSSMSTLGGVLLVIGFGIFGFLYLRRVDRDRKLTRRALRRMSNACKEVIIVALVSTDVFSLL